MEEEVFFSNTRREVFEAPGSVLTYAQKLIAEGRYLEGDDPFADDGGDSTACPGCGLPVPDKAGGECNRVAETMM